MVQVKKSGKHLQFTVDGRVLQYDLSTGESISPSGNIVHTLAPYFKGQRVYSIINSLTDENFRRWFNFILARHPKISNMGSLLTKLREAGPHLEQFFCSGLKYSNRPPTEKLDPRLARVLKKYDEPWCTYTDNLCEIIGSDHLAQVISRGHLSAFTYNASWVKALLTAGYQVNLILEYLEYLEFSEGERSNYILRDILDYWQAAQVVSSNPSRYPRNFRTVKQKTNYRFALKKEKYCEEAFQQQTESKISQLEWVGEYYQIVHPKTAEDIRTEGTQLSHCVASYVPRVIAGKTNIVFLRSRAVPDAHLITVQLDPEYQILQVRGRDNREATTPEQLALDTYQAWVVDPEKLPSVQITDTKTNVHRQPGHDRKAD